LIFASDSAIAAAYAAPSAGGRAAWNLAHAAFSRCSDADVAAAGFCGWLVNASAGI